MERRDACKKVTVRDLNAHLVCVLCKGYYIDASTLLECLHSFCRGCIIRHLESSACCPVCSVPVNKAMQGNCIRADAILQSLVYKLVPTVYQKELAQRQEFYSRSDLQDSTLPPNYGLSGGYFSPDDSISLSLQYYNGQQWGEDKEDTKALMPQQRRYLQCPAAVSMKHLKKFIRMKYGLSSEHRVDVIYAKECLRDDFTLMDVAYTFNWQRMSPMRFSYRIFQRPTARTVSDVFTNNLPVEDGKSVSTVQPASRSVGSKASGNVSQQESSIRTSHDEPSPKKLRITGLGNEDKPEVTGKDNTTEPCAEPQATESTTEQSALIVKVKKDKEVKVGPISENCSEKPEKKDNLKTSDCNGTSLNGSTNGVERKRKREKSVETPQVLKIKEKQKQIIPEEENKPEKVDTEKKIDNEKKIKEEKDHGGKKKGKHKFKYLKSLDDKKRPIIVSPTILQNPDDVMKLKVKLTPVPVPSNLQSNHHHKHHHHSKHHHSKHHKSTNGADSATMTSTANKERLLQMRAVRHKANKPPRAEKSIEEIFQKQKANLLVPPSTIIVSKVNASDKRPDGFSRQMTGNCPVDSKRPSLEIMLVTSKKNNTSAGHNKSDTTLQGCSDPDVMKPQPPTIPRPIKNDCTPIKTPRGLTITPKVSPKPTQASTKIDAVSPKVSISMKAKKQSESGSKTLEYKFSETASQSPKLRDLPSKLSGKSVNDHSAFAKEQSIRHDTFGALDLSGKSSRKSDTESPPNLSVDSHCEYNNERPKLSELNLAFCHNFLRTKPTSSANGEKSSQNSPAPAPKVLESNLNASSAGMSNLQTLSDAAVRIRNLMTSETKPHSTNNLTPNNNNNNNLINKNNSSNNNNTALHLPDPATSNSSTPPSKIQSMPSYTSGSTLRIPVPRPTLKYPIAGGRGMPRLNEIISRGRASLQQGIKPGPNLGVRHIPNPSALFRQQSINKNGTGNQIKKVMMYNGMSNGSTASVGTPSAAVSVAPSVASSVGSSRLTTAAAPIRKIENMTRDIEKVAAGLAVRAVEANAAK